MRVPTVGSDLENSTAGAMARLLLSGPVGAHLFSALTEQFRTASRFDVFLGVALAIALLDADLAVAEAELALARRAP
jgi:hypothetical protein